MKNVYDTKSNAESKLPFCYSVNSRLYAGDLYKRDEDYTAPPIDEDGFQTALLDLFLRHPKKIDPEKLLRDIHLINDTFIMSASTISMVTFNQKSKPVISSSKTIFGVKKKRLKDWKLDKINSISAFISQEKNYDSFIFNHRNLFVRDENSVFLLNVDDLEKNYEMSRDNYSEFVDAVFDCSIVLDETDFSLFTNNKGEYEYPVNSTLLIPIANEKNLKALLFIGYPVMDIFFFANGMYLDHLMLIKQMKMYFEKLFLIRG